MPDAGKRSSITPCATHSPRCGMLLCCAMLLASCMSTVALADESTPVPLTQRLSAARAALSTADAAQPPQPSMQVLAVEHLFDLLDESALLESDEAETLLDREIALRSSEGSASAAHALALERRARLQRAHFRLADSIATARQALALIEHLDAPEARATIRATLGGSLSTLQQADDAVPLLQAAIAWFDAHQIADLRVEVALRDLSFAYRLQSKLDDAQAAVDRARTIAVTLDGAHGAQLAETLTFEAFIPRARGDVAAAISMLEQALAILKDAQPPLRTPYARALLSLAQTLNSSGDGRGCEQRYREGIALEQAHPSAGGMLLAGMYNGLGLYLITEERASEAVPNLENALAIYRALFGADYKAVWYAENNLALAYRYLGRLDESAALLRHVVEVTDRAPYGSDEATTPARSNLGVVYLWQGRYAEAEQLFRSFLARIGPDHDFGETDPRPSMEGLAASLWAQGRIDAAFAQALATERSRQRLIRTQGADLSERHALAMSEYVRGGLDWALAIAAQSRRPQHVRATWELALETHGLVNTISMRRLAAARAASDPHLAQVWTAWKEHDEALVQARVDASRDPSPHTVAALDATERQFDAAERALAHAVGARGAALDHAHARLGAILAALPENALLVSYVEADSVRPQDLERVPSALPGRLYAFVGQRGAPPQLLDLGPRPPVQAAVQEWLQRVVDRHADARERTASGQRVRALIWDAIGKRWPQRRMLIVPSPLLDRVPFAALPAADGRYLVEQGRAFHLLDHERDILAATAAANAPARTPTLSLIGAPDFSAPTTPDSIDTRGVCSSLRGAVFAPLPQAALEIEQLRGLWLQDGSAPLPVVLAGPQATEASARASMPTSTIVHFATHGMYLGKECVQATPAARGIKTVDTAPAAPDGAQDFAALVLSGADRSASDPADDGLLTSEEIEALDLSHTEWAVLSACDSGIGKSVSNEGVFGLRRAFRLAGAHSVIMSLWPVDDRASADWMAALYRTRLREHAATIEAVRAADLALIAQRRQAGLDPAPYFWAAYVAAGDWR
jgi:CHAT domain-containing protein/tetratricopeptide (TPR) repeat protein